MLPDNAELFEDLRLIFFEKHADEQMFGADIFGVCGFGLADCACEDYDAFRVQGCCVFFQGFGVARFDMEIFREHFNH